MVIWISQRLSSLNLLLLLPLLLLLLLQATPSSSSSPALTPSAPSSSSLSPPARPSSNSSNSTCPESFTSIQTLSPSILREIRYATSHNFIGHPIRGYLSPECILTLPAAEALARVQEELLPLSLSLKVYDCYRPQKAVDEFMAWGEDLADQLMKLEFYPFVDKAALFRDGYIASKSRHSQGSTVDLTIVRLPPGAQEEFNPINLRPCTWPEGLRFGDNSLDMGSGFDCFDPISHIDYSGLGEEQFGNRIFLKELMERHGWVPYDYEWWHFTLSNPPFPDTYFDFDVMAGCDHRLQSGVPLKDELR